MGRDYYGCVFGDVAGSFFCTFFDDEAAESAEVDVFAVSEAIFNHGHEIFNDCENVGFVDAGCLCNLGCDICFCHNSVCSEYC